MVQHCHGHGGHHGDFLVVVLEDEDHVEVLEAELDSLKVNQLHVLQGADERRPGGEIYQAAGGWLQQHCLAVGHALRLIN